MKKKEKKAKRNPQLEKMINMFLDYVSNIDEEMEHGCYSVPEWVPPEYEDEEDYYGNHEKIVNRVSDSYAKIRKFIEKYEKSVGK